MVNRAAGVLLVWLSIVPLASAQAPDPPPAPAPPAGQEPGQEPGKEPVQVAEASPQRSFLSSLVHQLGSDLKHIPRRNSVYWLAGGTAGALAIHPADDDINARLVGSDFADAFFKPGKLIGSTPFILSAAAATYIWGRTHKQTRVRHLGMDLIESTLLAEGITQLIKVAVRRDRPIHPDGSTNPGTRSPRVTRPSPSPLPRCCSSTSVGRPRCPPTCSRPTSRCHGCTTTGTSRATSCLVPPTASSSAGP